jgi:hypothetical protein
MLEFAVGVLGNHAVATATTRSSVSQVAVDTICGDEFG